MTKYLSLFSLLLMALISGCDPSSDCGADKITSNVDYNFDFFSQPSEIYWGVTGSTRSYTYNWTFGNICTKKNPKVDFLAALEVDNTTLSNPFSFSAGTYTCFGVSAQLANLLPSGGVQSSYESTGSEIGMQQCFSGQSSATIYPYITVSFTTLGSSAADSAYLVHNMNILKATVSYSEPK